MCKNEIQSTGQNICSKFCTFLAMKTVLCERYSEKLLYSLSRMEERAAKRLGEDKIRRMTELFMEYDQILEEALEETDDEE